MPQQWRVLATRALFEHDDTVIPSVHEIEIISEEAGCGKRKACMTRLVVR